LIVVKLGGSVITNKEKLRSFRRKTCLRLCKELRPARHELILVHGAGSFGHILAEKAALSDGVEKGDMGKLRLISHIHRDVLSLNAKVLFCMDKNRLHGFSIPPYSIGSFTSGEIHDFCPEKFERVMSNGYVPVTFGDIVPDRELTFSICSGDLLMLELARYFEPEKVIFVTDVDGIYDHDPKISSSARLMDVVSPENIDLISAGTRKKDVTGAMKMKLARMIEIAKHCENCMILNGNAEGRLEDAIEGRDVISTRVIA
jgi:isopentenyl phosphate kinase